MLAEVRREVYFPSRSGKYAEPAEGLPIVTTAYEYGKSGWTDGLCERDDTLPGSLRNEHRRSSGGLHARVRHSPFNAEGHASPGDEV